MKFFLLGLFIFTGIRSTQSLSYVANSGEKISSISLNENLIKIKNKMEEVGVYIGELPSQGLVVEKNLFNTHLNILKSYFNDNEPIDFFPSNEIKSQDFNNYFNYIFNLINTNLFINCEGLITRPSFNGRGVYKLSPGGWDAPSKEFICENGNKTKERKLIKSVNNEFFIENHDDLYSLARYGIKEDLTFSGTLNIKHNNSNINVELIELDGGTYPTSNYCDDVHDSKMCMVRFKGDTFLNGTHTTLARKKGFVIYVDGNLTLNNGALISMSKRGANAIGQNINVINSRTIPAYDGAASGQFITIRSGNDYSLNRVNHSPAGGNAQNGGSGGGGSGFAVSFGGLVAISGKGAQGTSWAGGGSGGSATARSADGTAGNAQPNGGAGGLGAGTWDWTSNSGNGNPAGAANGAWVRAGVSGLAGTVIVFVNGDIIMNGNIISEGSAELIASHKNAGTGGGIVQVFFTGEKSGSGTVSAKGGDSICGSERICGGKGGNGTALLEKTLFN